MREGGKEEEYGLDKFIETIPEDAKYSGFNLLMFAPSSSSSSGGVEFDAGLLTNHGASKPLSYRPLQSDECSCGGLSNGVDGAGASEWPKVVTGKDAFRKALSDWEEEQRNGRNGGDNGRRASEEASEDDLVERLFDLLL